ncbi:hypothetical protein NDU88_003066 [Pleurodeles waltl]|uniref:Uncharacterized protein n=1 Tax=Pleurodeles waltl TaxID=8319 RepID=A0AAV7KUI1_PLEWA|nr:hypothetical protein NDU88_003066 [Pleurodeles waltl]
MDEDQVVEQQDDLERMIAHVCAEALKRGKDWLRAKMVDTSEESRAQEAPALANLPDEAGATERSSPPSQKASKRQKSEGKPARKTAKRPRATVRSTEEDTAPKQGSSIARAPAEGEHISAIIQECFKSLAPLLLREIQLEGLDLTVCDKKDDDRRERKRARKDRNFENWLDAFRIMACVIVEKFPRCATDLWLYESKIHEAHRQFPGDAWLEYDKSFRLKM